MVNTNFDIARDIAAYHVEADAPALKLVEHIEGVAGGGPAQQAVETFFGRCQPDVLVGRFQQRNEGLNNVILMRTKKLSDFCNFGNRSPCWI
jgi:hypothetical protein